MFMPVTKTLWAYTSACIYAHTSVGIQLYDVVKTQYAGTAFEYKAYTDFSNYKYCLCILKALSAMVEVWFKREL